MSSSRRRREMFEVFRFVDDSDGPSVKSSKPKKKKQRKKAPLAGARGPSPADATIALGRNENDSVNKGTVVLRVEEAIGFVGLGIILVVASFLIGWHGHGREEGTVNLQMPVSGAVTSLAEGSDNPVYSTQEVPVNDVEVVALSASDSEIEEKAGWENGYTIEALRVPPGDHSVAREHLDKLRKAGFVPARILPKKGLLAVCVGNFASESDVKAVRWQQELRSFQTVYARSQIVPVVAN